MFPNSKRCPCLPLWRIHACMAFLMDLRVASSLRMPRLCLRMSWLAQAAGPLFQQKNCFRTSFSCHMGSLGYAKCHWCKTEGWNFYIPDNVGGPLCGKCLRGDDPTDQKENPTDMKANVHSAAAEDRVQHRGTESTWYWTKQSNDQTGSTGRNLTPLTRSGPYTIDHVGNRGAAADPRDLSTGANLETYPRDSPYRLKHSAATDNRMPHHWTRGTLHTRRSNDRTRSTGTNLTPSTRSEPYRTDLAPDAKHQMENEKVEAEYRTCWREKLKQKTMRKVEELQKELLLQSTSPPEQPRNVATDTAPPESASRT